MRDYFMEARLPRWSGHCTANLIISARGTAFSGCSSGPRRDQNRSPPEEPTLDRPQHHAGGEG